jgi:hypothetical protein
VADILRGFLVLWVYVRRCSNYNAGKGGVVGRGDKVNVVGKVHA